MPQERNVPRTMLGSAFLLAFAMFAPMLSVPPMEHILVEELQLTHVQTGLIFVVPIIMMVALSIPGGMFADKIGMRRAAGIGAIIIAAGSMLRGTAGGFSSLLTFTFVYGVGFGLVFPNLPKLVSSWTSRERAGMATGVFTAGIVSGNALPLTLTIPVVFPITNSYQGTFLIWGIPAVVATILWWTLVKEPPHNAAAGEVVGQVSIPFRHVLQNKNLWLLAALLSVCNFFHYVWTGWIPAVMMQKGAAPDQATLITSVMLWAAIPSVLFLPRLSYKLGLRKPFLWVPSFILAGASLGMVCITIPMSWPLMALVGVVHGVRFATILSLPVELMPKEVVGVASGFTFSVGYIGGIIGPLVGGRIFDVTGSLDLSLHVLVGVSVGAGLIALRMPETGRKARLQG